ncbi:MAG TPA: betaine/proline/choline family ABC transporter ATP-binding protein [Geminicoccaceae bacterium]|nr:betaine/proline/choline family ABC transporter ATP-binding protein [Geminicoccus sp.]HMU51520.1 betaine/proline/choline family ABC transporter ATP-binding protein [Geminicoccaceae bacterium]
MRPVKLACRNLWKLFGPGAERLRGRLPDPEGLAGAGLIAAVRDTSIEVAAGEIFVIMGLSGSGKSTLVRCLSRLVEPSAGEVLVEGRDILGIDEAELIRLRRHEFGMVFQHFALLPHLNVLNNVAFPLEIQGVERARRESRAREMLALVGLEGREAHFPRQLSGGQQQRVGIARSLAAEPEIWLLDEPFSALDPLIRRELQAELLRLQTVLRKTIVFITHDFDEAIRLADRIAIMKDGAIVQTGTAEDLVTAPATPYVAEFTRDVPRARVLSARAAMVPAEGLELEGEVEAGAKVGSVAARALAGGRPLAVVEQGRVIGALTREAVAAALIGRDGGHA